MRRLAPLLALLALAVGCGGDESTDPLVAGLSYLPADTPFVAAVDTNLQGDQVEALDSILKRFPVGGSIEGLLRQAVEEGEGDYDFDGDLKPLLGNPFVVGSTDVASFVGDGDDGNFVGAIEEKETGAIDRLIEQTKPEEHGEVAGAAVYEDEGTFFAVEGEVLVLAGSRGLLEDALERRDGDDRLDPDAFEAALADLPDEALARFYVDVQALIEQDPDTAGARRVEWVSSLRTLGLTASAQEDSIDVEFNLRGEGDELSDQDLPLAAGDDAPGVAREDGEIGLAVRDPSQIVDFFESAFQAVEPAQFGDYETAKRALAQQLDLDLDEDVIAQLTGDLSVSVAVDGGFGARAEVAEPARFRRTVDKLADALPRLGAGAGVTGVRRRGELYEAALVDGSRLAFGMVGDAFVVASDPARARRLGAASPADVPGAEGSFAAAADAEQVAGELIGQLGPQLGLGSGGALGARLFAGPLGDVTGSISTGPDGLRGRFSLAFDD